MAATKSKSTSSRRTGKRAIKLTGGRRFSKEERAHFTTEARPSFEPPQTRLEYIPGEVIIRVEPGAIRPHIEDGRAQMTMAAVRSVPDSVLEPLDYLRRNAGLTDVEPLVPAGQDTRSIAGARTEANRTRLAVATSVMGEDDELAGIATARISAKAVTPALLRKVASAASVEFIEPMPARWLCMTGADPMLNTQWGLRAIRWFDATKPDASTLKVGVMDTGVDTRHPDLEDTDVTYDHTGTSTYDVIGHGTHVSGIIAAQVNNAVGIAGVARCGLNVWKIFNDEPANGGFYVDGRRFHQALVEASRAGITTMNLSIGGSASSRTEEILFRRLADSGVTVFAAMGNDYERGNPISYPAAYENVAAVGSIAENRRRSAFSNTGDHIDLVAPGSNILSTLPTRRSAYRDETTYAVWSGTSMATPHATATAAMVAFKNPAWGPAEVVSHLRAKAAPVAAMGRRSWTEEYGAGLLDVARALS